MIIDIMSELYRRIFRARERRDEVHNDDSFDMVDVAMAMRRLTSLKLLLLLAMVLPRYVS